MLVLAGGYILNRSRLSKAASSSNVQSVDIANAKQMMKTGAVSILDVRTPMEISAGKLSNAKTINIASPSFRKEINKLDKDATYIVYCRSGNRSLRACNIMSQEGFKNLYNLEGGYNAWK